MDFKGMSDEQIISYCKKNNIKHLNKQGKPYTRKTLIKYINEDVKIEVKEKKPKKEVKEKKVVVKEKKQDIDYFLNLKEDYNKVLDQEKYVIIKNIMKIYTSLKKYKYISKSLLELCDIKYGNKISKTDPTYAGEIKKKDHPQYPVYDSGNKPIFYATKYNRSMNSCKISTKNVTYDNCVMLLFDNFYLTNDAFTIKSSDDMLLDEYLFVYLYANKDGIMECVKNNVLDVDKFLSIKIKIPTNLEIQDKCYKEFYKIWNTYQKIEQLNNEIVEKLEDIKKSYK